MTDRRQPSPLERAVERYLRHVSIERGLSANTVAAYRRDLTSYLAVLLERDIVTPDSIAQPDVAAFAATLRTREEGALMASSMARMLSSVRSFHRFLVDEGLVSVDVAADTKPPISDSEPWVLAQPELKRLPSNFRAE